MIQEAKKESLEKILEDYRVALVKTYGPLGLYIYLRFKKDIKIESCKSRDDIEIGFGRLTIAILERVKFFTDKLECIKEGGAVQDVLDKVKEGVASQEDQEIFDVLKKERVVDDGLDRLDPLWEKLTAAQKKKFLKVDLLDPLAQIDFFYDLFTGPGTKGVRHKKKPVPKNKKKGRK